MILNINYNVSHHMGMSQMCAGADHYFRSSKPHSRKLWDIKIVWVDTSNIYSTYDLLFTMSVVHS